MVDFTLGNVPAGFNIAATEGDEDGGGGALFLSHLQLYSYMSNTVHLFFYQLSQNLMCNKYLKLILEFSL